jgi:hypothetical protein
VYRISAPGTVLLSDGLGMLASAIGDLMFGRLRDRVRSVLLGEKL